MQNSYKRIDNTYQLWDIAQEVKQKKFMKIYEVL